MCPCPGPGPSRGLLWSQPYVLLTLGNQRRATFPRRFSPVPGSRWLLESALFLLHLSKRSSGCCTRSLRTTEGSRLYTREFRPRQVTDSFPSRASRAFQDRLRWRRGRRCHPHFRDKERRLRGVKGDLVQVIRAAEAAGPTARLPDAESAALDRSVGLSPVK